MSGKKVFLAFVLFAFELECIVVWGVASTVVVLVALGLTAFYISLLILTDAAGNRTVTIIPSERTDALLRVLTTIASSLDNPVAPREIVNAGNIVYATGEYGNLKLGVVYNTETTTGFGTIMEPDRDFTTRVKNTDWHKLTQGEIDALPPETKRKLAKIKGLESL